MAGLVKLTPRGFFIRARQLDFDVFADVHRPNLSITHVGEGVLHSFSLWVQHCFFRCDNDFCFHE